MAVKNVYCAQTEFDNAVNNGLANLYVDHVRRQQFLFERLINHFGLTYLLIASGTHTYHFKDDREYPFKVNPYFKQWIPLTQSPGSYVLLMPKRKPILFLNKPEDCWMVWPGLESCDFYAEEVISNEFEVIEIRSNQEISTHLPPTSSQTGEGAFIGPNACLHSDWPIKFINDDAIVNFINYHRRFKTTYEVSCLYQANKASAPGHRHAFEIFKAGGSEMDIFMAYINAIQTSQQDAPYEPIVAENEHAGVLHYQLKAKTKPTQLHSLLIDAGASFAGYGSDISRTYSYRDKAFGDLIVQFDALQQGLVQCIEVGMTFDELNQCSRNAIAEFMVANQLASCSAEALLEGGLVEYFSPHGVSHFLGLQVHDVGWNLRDETGLCHAPVSGARGKEDRKIEPGMVFTVEPGIYFIQSKLDELRSGDMRHVFNWNRIDQLVPFGGIRIEDNISVGDMFAVNLTRLSLK